MVIFPNSTSSYWFKKTISRALGISAQKCQMPCYQFSSLKFCAFSCNTRFCLTCRLSPRPGLHLWKSSLTCCRSKLNYRWNAQECWVIPYVQVHILKLLKSNDRLKKAFHRQVKKSNCKVFLWQSGLACEIRQLYWTLYLKRTICLKLYRNPWESVYTGKVKDSLFPG